MKEGWKSCKWSDVLTIINGKNQKMVECSDGAFPIYGSGGIMGYANDWLCPENSVIIGRKGSINKPIFVDTKFWNVDTAFGLKADCNVLLPRFLYYFCENFNFEILNKAVTIPSLTKADLLKIDIQLPNFSEQQQIVEELDLLSGIIEKKKEQLKELDNLAQSIFYDMFGDSVANEKGWEKRSLKSLTSKIGSGATPKGGKEAYLEDGISLIRSLNVHNGFFKYEDLAHINDSQAEALNNVVIEENDVLLNITGASVARCCVVPSDILPARVNQHVCILRTKQSEVQYSFLCYQLISYNYQKNLLSISKANGATREALTKSQVEGLQIILPPLSLQQSFASKIEAIEKEKALIKQSITETETLFNSRMDYYFG